MRDLSEVPSESVDVAVSSSVLEHLTAAGQETALREMARVLKPGGMIGLTFDFGLAAPGANEHLPIPHDPPADSAEALRRYVQPGLVLAGNPFSEDPIAGSLFRNESIRYTVASLFLGKAPLDEVSAPKSESGASALSGLRVKNLLPRVLDSAHSQSALLQRSAVLEQACVERLAAIHDITSQLKCAIAKADEQRQRAARLERDAGERLAAMHEKDRLIAQLQAAVDACEAQRS
jgi:SAM-dependent methyltransferase